MTLFQVDCNSYFACGNAHLLFIVWKNDLQSLTGRDLFNNFGIQITQQRLQNSSRRQSVLKKQQFTTYF